MKGKEIKKALIEDANKYYQKDFWGNMDLSSAWGIARVILGENSNLTRMVKLNVVINPKRLANLFNNLFRTKIQLLREKTRWWSMLPTSK